MNRLILISLLCISIDTQAQTVPSVATVKTPEAGAIDKMIETPVSYSTGTANISIPLYEIQIKGVKVPITLNYNSSGIRVDEEATWVGLGWSLQYGGQISRTVEGKPDEYVFFNAGTSSNWSNYSIANYLTLPDIHTDCYESNRSQSIYQAKNPTMLGDYMPDEFYYSALGYSGRFMFNQETAKFVLFPKDDIKFNYTYSGTFQTFAGESNYYPIASWNMLAPDGTSVTFGQDGTSSSGPWLGGPGGYVTNAWMVKSINNRFGESINYTYNPFSYTLYKLTGQTYSYEAGSVTTNITNNAYNDANLKTITFPGGSIQFITAPRSDLPTQALSEIDVLDPSGQLIRKINLKYGYFDGNDGDISTATNDNAFANTGTTETSRLRLDTVSISNTGVAPINYVFSYYTPSVIPSKNSVDQDFWGYYNGPKHNSTLVPLMFNNQIQHGERQVDPNYNNAFLLHFVTYPTGGKTEFVYEPNTTLASNLPLYLQQDLQTQGQNGSYVTGGAGIEVSCFGRTTSYSPSTPDSIGPFAERYFRTTFTVPPGGGLATVGNNWQCLTNYVQNNTVDNSMYCSSLNVEFLLEQVNANGIGYTTIKTFWARNCSSNTFVGSDNEVISLNNQGMTPVTYRMSVVLWFPFMTLDPLVYANDPGPSNYFNSTNFNVSILNPAPPSTTPVVINVGGLRIKTINMYNSDGSLARQKTLSYNDVLGVTTGQLITIPVLYENVNDPTYGNDIKVFSNSVVPLQVNAGSYLGYTNVTETETGGTPAANLTTQYTYSFNTSPVDGVYGYWKQGVVDGLEWERGQLLSAKYLKNGKPVRQENYVYYVYSPNLPPSSTDLIPTNSNEDYVDEINTNFISYDVLGAASGSLAATDFFDPVQLNYPGFPPNNFNNKYWFYSVGEDNLPTDVENCPNSIFTAGMYPSLNSMPSYIQHLPYFQRYTGFSKLSSKTTVTYDDEGNNLTETENYLYDETPGIYQMTRVQHIDSKGELLQTQIKYPIDSISVGVYNTMVSRNMVNYPIAHIKTKNGAFLESDNTCYQPWTTSLIAPFVVQTTTGANPQESRFQYYAYDATGNILSGSKLGDALTSYIYDYNSRYTVAMVTNAGQADIAYTSFEADGLGNWNNYTGTVTTVTTGSPPPTGSRYYNLTPAATLSRSGLTSGNVYIISYWSGNGAYSITGGTPIGSYVTGKTIGSWTYYEHKIQASSATLTLTGTGMIDEVRLYPANAQMVTSTYAPLVGMTSKCDMDNRISYYVYDALQRLQYIKDQDGNIIKTYQYHYKGQ